MASFIDILAPNRVPDTRGIERRRGPADLESCVWFDLRTLLNTRRPPDSFTAGYPELPTSILNFGLRDFMFADMVTTEDRERLAREITAVINEFEPRLTDVRVTATERREPDAGKGDDPRSRHTIVHYHIAARLVGPDGEYEAAFENVFEWTTGHHEVTPT